MNTQHPVDSHQLHSLQKELSTVQKKAGGWLATFCFSFCITVVWSLLDKPLLGTWWPVGAFIALWSVFRVAALVKQRKALLFEIKVLETDI